MTIEERVEQLSMLMPSIGTSIIAFLAADNALKPWTDTAERRKVFHEPLMEFFRKFRIDRKKMQRILNSCGDAGAVELKNSYWYWQRESGTGEANDMGTVAEVGRAVTGTKGGETTAEDVASTAQQVLSENGKREPYLKNLDATRCALILRCDSVLKQSGRYRNKRIEQCHSMLRSLVRKCELDSKRRPPEHWIYPNRRQPLQANVVYADGKFGDGAEYYKELDENGRIIKQGKRSKIDPLVPEFLGLSRHEQQLLVGKLYEQQQQQKKDSGVADKE